MGEITFLPPREVRPATPAMDFSDRLKIASARAELAMCLLHINTATEALAHTGSDVDRRSASMSIHRAQETLAELSLLLSPRDGIEPEPPETAA